MILSSETTPQDAQQMLEFYKQNFAVVEIVSCSKCGAALAFECSGGESMGLAQNELGKYIIPIGDHLLSSRVRLDEAPTGERMMGYQCGAPVLNPEFDSVIKKWEEETAAYEKQYQKDLKKAMADKAAKKDETAEAIIHNPPVRPAIDRYIPCGNDTRIAEVERGKVPVGRMQQTLSPFEKHQIREKIREDRKHKPDFRKVGNIKHFESFQVERV